MTYEPGASGLGRRGFLGLAGAATAAGLMGTAGTAVAAPARPPLDVAAELAASEDRRRATGMQIRTEAARRAYGSPFPDHPTNGEESSYPDYPYLGMYHKGLPHNEFGEVDPAAYEAMVAAFASGQFADFEAIPPGTSPIRPQLNPLSALAYENVGADSHGLVSPPVPRLDSAAGVADAAENYWMAICRDIPFTEYGSHPDIAAAAAELSRLSDFRGPTDGGTVTPGTIFRGEAAGDLVGPWVSQLLLRDVTYGTMRFSQRHDTVAPGVEYLTTWEEYLAVQNGAPRPYLPGERDIANPRYLRNGRDMAHWTHFDQVYQAYLCAALILIGTGTAPGSGNPYIGSTAQMGFATWGTPALHTLIAEASTRGLKANLYQQFAVHRRLRPEAHGARYEVHLNRSPGRYEGILHPELVDLECLGRTRARFGNVLMPMAFKEGAPMSPEHPSGHAINSAACVTVLKAWFDEDFPMADPVVPNADGTELVPYTGSDAGSLTVGGELNKLYSNVGYGRNFGGMHTRTSIIDSRLVGEEVAISVLRDHLATVVEGGSFSFTRFDGTPVTIEA